VKPPVSGTSTAPVTVTGWPGKSPTVGYGMAYGAYLSSLQYVTVSDLVITSTVDQGIYVSGGSNITISGNEVSDAGHPVKGEIAQGIRLTNTSNALVTRNYTHNNSDSGIFLSGSTTATTVSYNLSTFNAEGYQRNANGINVISSGNTILGNTTHDNEDSGIQFYPGGNNNLATLNLTYNNGDHGIDDYNVTGGRLIGNTAFHNCTTGINVEGTSGNYVVENNIAVDNAVYPAYNGISCNRRTGNIGIWDSAPSTTTVDHNLVWLSKSGTMYVFGSSYSSLAAMQSATGQEKHGIQADPQFVAPSSGDFRLQAGSPAIDRGNSGVSGEQATDISGNARVDDPGTPNTWAQGPRLYDDLGAYEFQGSTTPPPSPPTASLTVSPQSGTAPLAVTADASGSTDPQGEALSYSFDFGGSPPATQSGATASYTFSSAGSYQVTVTVTDTSGLSSTAAQTVTVSNPSQPSPPTASLTVSPQSGTAPLAVTADASGSTDPQGEALSYSFDFGGNPPATQSGATASYTFSSAGTYQVSVTVTDTSGLSATATQAVTVSDPPPPSSTPPAFVDSIANNYSTSTHTSGYITVWRSQGVAAGDLAVLTVQLTGTSATGPVSGTDAAGNSYTAVADISDGGGNRVVLLAGVVTKALVAGDQITVSFPSAATYRIGGDEFSGLSAADGNAGAVGTSSSFSSGPAQATAGNEMAYGAVSIPNGTGSPTWSSGWTSAGSYSVGSRYLARAYQPVPASGGYAATGTATGAWLAVSATLR
jgi:parallel beta-helix repeat protein